MFGWVKRLVAIIHVLDEILHRLGMLEDAVAEQPNTYEAPAERLTDEASEMLTELDGDPEIPWTLANGESPSGPDDPAPGVS